MQKKLKPETVSVKASELLKNGKVAVRVAELEEQAKNMKPGSVSVNASQLLKSTKVALRVEKIQIQA